MSSGRRLTVSNDLVKKLDEFYKIVIEYKDQHKDDPDYYRKLTKPLNELRTKQTGLMKDVDYVNEVVDRCTKFERCKKQLDENSDNIGYQDIYSHSLNNIIKDLKDEIDLFDHAATLQADDVQKIHSLCQTLISELSSLKEDVISFIIQTLIEQLQQLSEIIQKNHADNHNEFNEHCLGLFSAYKIKPKESKEPTAIYLSSLPVITVLKKDINFFQKLSPSETDEHALCNLIIRKLDDVSDHANSFKK